mmetsp:Transcript_37403/g.38087  ORF Transcript_37403/g.38087 Transcript_37403/m.38087 type:complete len:376 (+) Transcript_37403:119-1246(+)
MGDNKTIEEIFEYFGTGEEEKSDFPSTNTRESKKDYGVQDNEGVDVGQINASEAFEVFQGKAFNIPNIDSKRVDYSVADKVEQRVESPLQRFTRLRAELTELHNDLNSMVKDDLPNDSNIWSTLLNETKQMQQNMYSLESHQCLQQSMTHNSVSKAVNNLQEISNKLQPTSTSTSIETDKLQPVSSAAMTDINLAKMEQRVYALELLLGSASNALDMEAVVGTTPKSAVFPLIQTITRLERRVSLLDKNALETIQNKAVSLRLELETISRDKNKLTAEQKAMEAAKKVGDLYDKVQRIENVMDDLPVVLTRLKTLERLHQSAGSFAVRLSDLEGLAKDLDATSRGNDTVLTTLKETLSTNINLMTENMNQVDKKN